LVVSALRHLPPHLHVGVLVLVLHFRVHESRLLCPRRKEWLRLLLMIIDLHGIELHHLGPGLLLGLEKASALLLLLPLRSLGTVRLHLRNLVVEILGSDGESIRRSHADFNVRCWNNEFLNELENCEATIVSEIEFVASNVREVSRKHPGVNAHGVLLQHLVETGEDIFKILVN